MSTLTRPVPKLEPKPKKREGKSQTAAIPEEKIEAFLSNLTKAEQKTLDRCTEAEVTKLGYSSVVPSGTIWMRAQRIVAANLIRADMRLSDIEFAED